MTASDRFEDRLLDHLRQVVVENPVSPTEPSSRRRPRRRTGLSHPGASGAPPLAVVAIVAGSGGVTSSAYAVQPQSNGMVEVSIQSIQSLSDIDGLEHSLQSAGIPATIEDLTNPAECAVATPDTGDTEAGGATEGESAPTGEAPEQTAAPDPDEATASAEPGPVTGIGGEGEAVTFLVDPTQIGPGERLHIQIARLETPGGTATAIEPVVMASGSTGCAASGEAP